MEWQRTWSLLIYKTKQQKISVIINAIETDIVVGIIILNDVGDDDDVGNIIIIPNIIVVNYIIIVVIFKWSSTLDSLSNVG